MMQIRVRLSTGDVLYSDPATREAMQEKIGPYGNLDDIIEEMKEGFKQFKELNHVTLICGGQETFINPAHIVTIEFLEDES